MENKAFTRKDFIRSSVGLLTTAPVFIIAVMAISVLYGVNQEYMFYFIAMYLIFLAIALAVNYSAQKKMSAEKEAVLAELRKDDMDVMEEKKRENEDFFALWTHQIKTPISALNVLLQAQEINRKDCRQELIKIEDYVSMVLGYMRYDTIQNDLILKKYNLNDIVKETVKKYAPLFIYNNISVGLENLDYMILTDDKWFSFVLDQILSNALKYTKGGSVRIDAQEKAGDLLVMISDTGIGIKKEDIGRVFEKGFTGYNGRVDKNASGIGLYLCKKICDNLGHEIQIQSEMGRGTDVTIILKYEKINKNDLTKM